MCYSFATGPTGGAYSTPRVPSWICGERGNMETSRWRQAGGGTPLPGHECTHARPYTQTDEQVGNNSSSATSTGRLWRLFMCEAFISKCTFSLRWSRSSFLPYKRLLSCYLQRRSAHLLRHNAVQRRTIFWNYFTPQAQALKIVVHILDTTSMTKRLWKHRFSRTKSPKWRIWHKNYTTATSFGNFRTPVTWLSVRCAHF